MNSDFIDINLLPRPVRPALGGPIWLRWMMPGVILLVVGFLLVLGATALKLRNDRVLAEQRRELTALRQEVRTLSALLLEVQTLQEQVTTLAVQAAQLEADAERVAAENPSLAPFLQALTEPLLPRMKLTGLVNIGGNRYLVSGEAGSDALVVTYAQALERRAEVRNVTPRTVERLSGGAPGTVRWTLEVTR